MARALILAVCVAAATPALASQPVTLRAETTDADGVVTFADLFEGAGAAGRIAVARRPQASLVLDAGAVQAAARRAGLDWDNAEGLRRIVVRQGPDGTGGAAAARGNVQVLSYARDLAAGDVVQPQDLIWTRAAARPAGAPSDADAVIGMTARRPLRAGAPAAARDMAPTPVVKAGEIVTVTYEDGGISLSLQARAMAAAGVAETLNVQNTASGKIVQAVVAGPGQAVVGPAADELKSLRSSRFALR